MCSWWWFHRFCLCQEGKCLCSPGQSLLSTRFREIGYKFILLKLYFFNINFHWLCTHQVPWLNHSLASCMDGIGLWRHLVAAWTLTPECWSLAQASLATCSLASVTTLAWLTSPLVSLEHQEEPSPKIWVRISSMAHVHVESKSIRHWDSRTWIWCHHSRWSSFSHGCRPNRRWRFWCDHWLLWPPTSTGTGTHLDKVGSQGLRFWMCSCRQGNEVSIDTMQCSKMHFKRGLCMLFHA